MMPQVPFARWVNTAPQAATRYGEIVAGHWSKVSDWCMLTEVPSFLHCVKNSVTGFPFTHLYCNKDMKAPLFAAFQNIKDAGLGSELHTFDGCYSIRPIRGNEKIQSAHSWAGAIDFNASENKLDETPSFSNDLVQCFKCVGFAWGGDFERKDGMHFSWLQF